MISKIDRRQAYKELKSIIKRLQKAEAELDKLSIYKHRFPKQFLSIKTITKSPAKVDEVEKELKQIVIMIAHLIFYEDRQQPGVFIIDEPVVE